MQKKKVLLLTYGNIDHASSRIRGVNHFNRMEDEFETTWIPRVGIHHQRNPVDRLVFIFMKAFYLLKKYFCILFARYDIAFVQIIFLPEWVLKTLKRKGTVICYDFDDAVYTYSQSQFDRMINYADKIVIASPFLADSFDTKTKDYAIIYSPVDTDVITPQVEPHDTFTIGWIGSPWTQLHLESISKALTLLSGQIPFKLLVVGGDIKIYGVDAECIPWSNENELNALKRIDVGIMPLENHEWSPKKGGYKLYLYMAAGLPVVGTPSGINSLIIKDGKNGFRAQTMQDWVKALTLLYNDKNLLKEAGLNARSDAQKLYSYKACTTQLFNFLCTHGN
jgi:glycosyltransferase involved in cell wall biosynthesis